MSFLFGKKNKQQQQQQNNALPPATRDISSSHGPGSQIPTANGLSGRDPEKGRGVPPPTQTPTPGASVNNSLSSLQNPATTASPEPKTLRDRADSDYQNPRSGRNPGDSPYPWSSRRLNFTTTVNPFPRYGAAINATASKDGVIYIMGGLVGGSTVKGDLWLTEMGNGSLACYPISTTGDGPGPRVGHASLLVGNAFIVFGGDTKLDDNDDLDDTLYLLNTSTKHWSRALPQGPRPTGRYGHTLNILGSKIYIFGGQVEGFFFNDLVAFDLNSLQSSSSRWEVLLPNTKDGTLSSPQGRAPPARTNHSVVTWNDKLYLFGGTDGVSWFNDVWTYEPRTNAWSELDCIGYIPVAREGHSATLVNDTMYIFGGRTQEGVDLGDLAAFRISSRRWYMFQNMGHSPSPRSGHSMTAFGKHVICLAGEPSSSASDRNELSMAYILDTSKIRYPPNENAPMQPQLNAPRKMSGGDRIGTGIPQGKPASPPTREGVMAGPQVSRSPDAMANGITTGAAGSRLPRAAPGQAPSGPPPLQQAPQPRANGAGTATSNVRSKTPTKGDRGFGPPVDTRAASFDRENMSPSTRESPSTNEIQAQSVSDKTVNGPRKGSDISSISQHQRDHKESMDTTRSASVVSRNTSRSHRQQHSLESIEQGTPRRSIEAQQRVLSREGDHRPVDSGVGASPALSQQNDELMRELEAARSRNAWYASELALARKAGYNPGASTSPILDERAADVFGDDDRPLLEALLKMKNELERVQTSIKSQQVDAAKRIAEVERQKEAAVNEAIYAKAKLAAHGGGSQGGTPQPDGTRSTATPDMDRINDINRRLAASLAVQSELSAKLEKLSQEVASERRAKQLAEDTAEAAQKRVQELDSSRQKNAAEFENLRAELHEAQRVAREASANATEAQASSRLLAVDKNELSTRYAKVSEQSKNHASILQSLRDAVSASSDKSTLLEKKIEEERYQRDNLEQKLAQLRSEHEDRTMELESASRKLRDAEELAEKYAEEARLHRQAVLSGLGRFAERDEDEHEAMDERVVILQQQVEAANAMVRKNQSAADQAYEKLRRAEERIAGLEAYQEQSSREGLTIRKQLQHAMRDMQVSEADKAELHQQYERLRLESNALEVQLKTLKNLLEERGVNPVDARRSRVLDSPSSRFGTPELNRVRELEQQIDAMNKAHEELRSVFEQREHDVSKEWEGKLQTLHSDHQAAVKYLRGTEKMLSKMKQELERYKNANTKLEEELTQARQVSRSPTKEQSSEWAAERDSLRSELSQVQANMKATVSQLETQLSTLQSELASARQEAEAAAKHAKDLESLAEQSRTDLEALRRQNVIIEERAREAETRVQMFLDQFENTVDNYRRQSQIPTSGVNGEDGGHRHHAHDSIASGDSMYSENDDSSTPDASSATNVPATRNSMALDNLASELDALRTHWETTNKAYRLSDRFDFEKSSTSEKSELSESLAQWRKRMDLDDDEHEKREEQKERKGSQSHPSAAPSTVPAGPGGSTMI
ncbi:cell polarity protein-like protein [Lindgomyces ingoldianus]|uniref:Cell polarity protein-like protein n=1 Tax=Lindgomyces ingoldianus TaxID=673940 RepID=A0ACB6RAV0_9PLEO|nr:cell polarity protein-like protein [Lindgomyces ingoldianus]KAF2476311.1 cell polarity protein-like protein [Lindgomyces ingoldianus]